MTEPTNDRGETEVLEEEILKEETLEEEASLALAHKHLLLNGDFSDVTLEGTDGEHIQAHRVILAARSKVFQKLLFGDFAEAKDAVIPVGFEGSVLHAIVEYCYTDKVSLCKEKVCHPYMAHTIVSLTTAADYFEFPKLRRQVTEYACNQIIAHKLLALPFLTAADQIVGSAPRIRECAVGAIQTDYTGSVLGLENKHITALSHAVLESIVSDNAIITDEIHLFRLVEQWSEGPTVEESAADEQQEDRKPIALVLIAKHTRFDRISYFDLSNTVTTSGLVTTEQLLEAYKSHAELASQNYSQPLKTKRMPCWENSNSTLVLFGVRPNMELRIIQRLRCREMVSGRHIWSIEVVTLSPSGKSMWLGVRSGQQEWIYGSTGKTWHTGSTARQGLPVYGVASVVTLTLDLTGTGELSASVDGGSNRVLFVHLFKPGDDGLKLKLSFVPIVSMKTPGAVRFKGFDSSSFH
jgi:hypothetical protein